MNSEDSVCGTLIRGDRIRCRLPYRSRCSANWRSCATRRKLSCLRKKTRALLAYLALANRRQRRDYLCQMLWNLPDDPRASLRWSLTKLRRVLNEDGDEPCLGTDGSSIFLDTNKLDVDLLHVAHITTKNVRSLTTSDLETWAALFRGRLESVRRDHAGLHSFLSMILIEARRRNASAFRLRFSQSLARRLHRPSHANVRSTTHRFGRTTNPFA